MRRALGTPAVTLLCAFTGMSSCSGEPVGSSSSCYDALTSEQKALAERTAAEIEQLASIPLPDPIARIEGCAAVRFDVASGGEVENASVIVSYPTEAFGRFARLQIQNSTFSGDGQKLLVLEYELTD